MACSVTDCYKKHHAKGYCKTHWRRWKKTGNPSLLLRAENGKGWIHRGYHEMMKNGRRAGVHTFVMESKLGRRLFSNESVHHKNGNRLDNRPENLELWVRSQPYGQRAVDLVKWAKEILLQYEPK